MGKFRANLDPISSDRPLAPMMPELGYITAWRMSVVGGHYPSYFQMIRKVVTQDITIHYMSGRPCFAATNPSEPCVKVGCCQLWWIGGQARVAAGSR